MGFSAMIIIHITLFLVMMLSVNEANSSCSIQCKPKNSRCLGISCIMLKRLCAGCNVETQRVTSKRHSSRGGEEKQLKGGTGTLEIMIDSDESPEVGRKPTKYKAFHMQENSAQIGEDSDEYANVAAGHYLKDEKLGYIVNPNIGLKYGKKKIQKYITIPRRNTNRGVMKTSRYPEKWYSRNTGGKMHVLGAIGQYLLKHPQYENPKYQAQDWNGVGTLYGDNHPHRIHELDEAELIHNDSDDHQPLKVQLPSDEESDSQESDEELTLKKHQYLQQLQGAALIKERNKYYLEKLHEMDVSKQSDESDSMQQNNRHHFHHEEDELEASKQDSDEHHIEEVAEIELSRQDSEEHHSHELHSAELYKRVNRGDYKGMYHMEESKETQISKQESEEHHEEELEEAELSKQESSEEHHEEELEEAELSKQESEEHHEEELQEAELSKQESREHHMEESEETEVSKHESEEHHKEELEEAEVSKHESEEHQTEELEEAEIHKQENEEHHVEELQEAEMLKQENEQHHVEEYEEKELSKQDSEEHHEEELEETDIHKQDSEEHHLEELEEAEVSKQESEEYHEEELEESEVSKQENKLRHAEQLEEAEVSKQETEEHHEEKLEEAEVSKQEVEEHQEEALEETEVSKQENEKHEEALEEEVIEKENEEHHEEKTEISEQKTEEQREEKTEISEQKTEEQRSELEQTEVSKEENEEHHEEALEEAEVSKQENEEHHEEALEEKEILEKTDEEHHEEALEETEVSKQENEEHQNEEVEEKEIHKQDDEVHQKEELEEMEVSKQDNQEKQEEHLEESEIIKEDNKEKHSHEEVETEVTKNDDVERHSHELEETEIVKQDNKFHVEELEEAEISHQDSDELHQFDSDEAELYKQYKKKRLLKKLGEAGIYQIGNGYQESHDESVENNGVWTNGETKKKARFTFPGSDLLSKYLLRERKRKLKGKYNNNLYEGYGQFEDSDHFGKVSAYNYTKQMSAGACLKSPCGLNSQCHIESGRAICTCAIGFYGNPLSECRPSECKRNSDCRSDLACSRNICVNLCAESCGINAICLMIDHEPVCTCPPGFTGNGKFSCRPIEAVEKCIPNPCGANTQCKIVANLPHCQCLPNYIGDPQVGCRRECEHDFECSKDRSCIDNRCQDSCKLCGRYAICESVAVHKPVCKCPPDYFGNPYAVCKPECVTHADCPSSKPTCFQFKCKNPCDGACGTLAQCEVHGINAVCSCPKHLTGNPLILCRPYEWKDFCEPNPCGRNARCELSIDDKGAYTPVCKCLPGFYNLGAGDCVPGDCADDLHCPSHKTCEHFLCEDACKNQCGKGSLCEATNHTAICSCPPGYRGNPTIECVKETKKPCMVRFCTFPLASSLDS